MPLPIYIFAPLVGGGLLLLMLVICCCYLRHKRNSSLDRVMNSSDASSNLAKQYRQWGDGMNDDEAAGRVNDGARAAAGDDDAHAVELTGLNLAKAAKTRAKGNDAKEKEVLRKLAEAEAAT